MQAKVKVVRRRGRHSEEFRERVVAACRAPGVSVAAVALANGLSLTVANGEGHRLQSQALARYASDGALPIDNNPVENVIRPVCLGKKNWLFVGSERAAAIQSLLATAELNGLDPAAWLRETLEKLPTCLNRDIDSLLPLARTA